MKKWFFRCFLVIVLTTLLSVCPAQRAEAQALPVEGNLILFWDGDTIPAGWTCISDDAGEPFYNRFPRGANSYGSTGGSETHAHDIALSLGSGEMVSSYEGDYWIMASYLHRHNVDYGSTTGREGPNIPPYRSLKVIRCNESGTQPIPAGAIAIFNESPPSGWTRYAAQDDRFIRGYGSVTTGGSSLIHSHNIHVMTGYALTTTIIVEGSWPMERVITAEHRHEFDMYAGPTDSTPPYITVILAKADVAFDPPPTKMVAMFDNSPPQIWEKLSGPTLGGPARAYNGRFLKGSTAYGNTGGSNEHHHMSQEHPDYTSWAIGGSTIYALNLIQSVEPIGSGLDHDHKIIGAGPVKTTNLPPYIDVIFALYRGKVNATVTLSNLTQTYTGSPLTPTATTDPPGLAITWTGAPQTNVGSYAVTATINDAFYQGSASGTFVISKATATVTLGNMTQTYTGSPLTPTATTSPPGLAITWTGAPQTNAGSYAVTATVNDANYTGSASGTFIINQATTTVTLSNMTQTYTGSALMPTATTSPSGLALTWTGVPQTNAGSYPVTATINDPNYQGSASGTFTINKAPATVTLSNLTQTYTGSALTPTATTNPSGLTVTWTGAPQTNAGSYPVTATITDANYEGSASGTFTINKKDASVTPNAATKIYGALEPALSGTLSGFLVGDGVSATYSRAGGENVGTYTISAVLSPAGVLGNYNITYNTATFTINKKTITVTADAKSKVYGSTDPALTYQITGGSLVTGDSFSGSLTRDAGENVGTYAIKQGSLALSSNYNLTFVGANLTVNKKAASVTPNAASKIYGAGDPVLSGTLSGFLVGDGVSATYSRTAGENIGTYTISAVLSPAGVLGNYNITYNTATFTINYGFKGLLPPYAAPPSDFNTGRSIPLKWQYTDFSGNVVNSSTAAPSITITFGGNSIPVGDPGKSGLQYDTITNTWQFNWQTKGVAAGTYQIWITSAQTGQRNGPFAIQLR